ncbi:MAG: ribosome silencing factor [Firmicutes bacterium]|nr:ribosome silencing factor [Bacillota bacterium]
MTAEKLLEECVRLAADKKARDLVSLKIGGLTTICDYFLLATATNTRQAQSICDNIEEGLKAAEQPLLRIEGYNEASWILMDVGTVIVHIFLPEAREHYDLERLWGDAERVEY